jgi:hypothetical protein
VSNCRELHIRTRDTCRRSGHRAGKLHPRILRPIIRPLTSNVLLEPSCDDASQRARKNKNIVQLPDIDMSVCLAPVYLRGGNFSDLYRQVRTTSFSEKVPDIENSPFESWPIPSRRELTPNNRCKLIGSVRLPSVRVPVNPLSGSASCWSPLSMLIALVNPNAFSEFALTDRPHSELPFP